MQPRRQPVGSLWPAHIDEATKHVAVSVKSLPAAAIAGGITLCVQSHPSGDPAVRRIVELALTEAQLVAETEERIAREMAAARDLVLDRVAQEQRREIEREDRARSRAAKENQCRDRIRSLRQLKEAETSAKRDAKNQAREVLLSHMESQSSSLQEQKAAAARERKAKIVRDREAHVERLAATVREHTEHVERVSQRRLEELAVSQMRGLSLAVYIE
jgi:hypothetical protein